MRYEFLQHMTSGDLFAVTMDDQQRVTAACGPISYREVNFAGDYNYDLVGDEVEDFNGDDWRLVDENELRQRRADALDAAAAGEDWYGGDQNTSVGRGA